MLQEVPSLSSSAGSGQHSDPVWQVCWVDRGLEQEERLVTISTDGRVTQWATTKVRLALHLECNTHCDKTQAVAWSETTLQPACDTLHSGPAPSTLIDNWVHRLWNAVGDRRLSRQGADARSQHEVHMHHSQMMCSAHTAGSGAH